MTSHPLFFGYGSLVNRATHDFMDPRPARLSGWERVWRRTSLREVAFLSVDPAPRTDILGLTARVPNGDWATLDAREGAYTRIDVAHAVSHDHEPGPTAVYRISEGLIEGPSETAPILLSYLDTVAAGFLDLYGEDGVVHFFETTTGWGPIRNDRAAPVYSRAQPTTVALTALVDRHLTAL